LLRHVDLSFRGAFSKKSLLLPYLHLLFWWLVHALAAGGGGVERSCTAGNILYISDWEHFLMR